MFRIFNVENVNIHIPSWVRLLVQAIRHEVYIGRYSVSNVNLEFLILASFIDLSIWSWKLDTKAFRNKLLLYIETQHSTVHSRYPEFKIASTYTTKQVLFTCEKCLRVLFSWIGVTSVCYVALLAFITFYVSECVQIDFGEVTLHTCDTF